MKALIIRPPRLWLSGAVLLCLLAIAPADEAFGRVRPPTELGDPDADEGTMPGLGGGTSGTTKFGMAWISVPSSTATARSNARVGAKLSVRDFVVLWLRIRIR
jgi:hypothetical protein